ncbi:MAG: non-canonical purine NTP pyrophosphatase [Gammaproteobacteria bacterium]|nr:non-canonical purine NTP pyrophosphatase [Gammaproteobacteria bacterium]
MNTAAQSTTNPATKTPETVVLATGNPSKIKEAIPLLGDLRFELRPQSDFQVPEADETGVSYVENALIKAYNAAKYCSHPCIAEDSGLMIDAFDGELGVFTHRFTSRFESLQHANQHIIDTINADSNLPRTARYVAVAVYVVNDRDPMPIICQGIWEGTISREVSGDSGFGQDPIFIPDGHTQTVAVLGDKFKALHSHRSQALRQLSEQLTSLYS